MTNNTEMVTDQNSDSIAYVREVSSITEADFEAVRQANQPVVIRGLGKHWPIVQQALAGDESLCQYLARFDRGAPLTAMQGPASNQGRIFYNQDVSGLNCRPSQSTLATALNFIQQHAHESVPPTYAIQSIVVPQHLPGLERELNLGLVPAGVEPRIWIGGKAIVAAHYDASENIAVCVAGKRRFTLFPPEQVSNLYPGPFEMTPAGAVISMVDFDQPDLEAHPRFTEALKHAQVAELEPGDGLYIPYLWWHHVRALQGLNVLVNYWWGEPNPAYGDPRNALFFAMMALNTLPESQRSAWQHHFNHYVFNNNGQTAQHLPKGRRGIVEAFSSDTLRRLKQTLVQVLSRH